MKSFANWMTVIFMTAFWIFRIIVTYMFATGKSFLIQPINYNIEIALLFITLICIILVVKRKMIGGIIYCITYLGYFGVDLYKTVAPMFLGETLNLNIGMDLFMSAVAVIISIAVMIDVLTDKVRTPTTKKTDWFYDNKDLDRKKDDRADKNNYKIM